MCDFNDNFFPAILFSVLLFVLGGCIGGEFRERNPTPAAITRAKSELMVDAVKAGLAEWVIVDDTGKTEIRFKSIQAEELLSTVTENKK